MFRARDRTMWYKLIGITLIFIFDSNVNAQYEGDVCNHTSKGTRGICKKLIQCSIAIDNLRLGIQPQNCGFVGKEPIVCCELDTAPTTTTTTTTATITRPQIDRLPVGEKSKLGDSCNHTSKGIYGICKKLTQCSIAIDNLRLGIDPQSCGIMDNVPIVCCPLDATTTTTTTATITRPQTGKLPVGEKSKLACKSYEMLAYKKLNSSQFYDEDELIENCPWKHRSVAVVNDGRVAEEGEFPHMAALGYIIDEDPDNYKWWCGGSLISERYVLTAAHCMVSPLSNEPKVVRLGDLDYTDPDDDQYVQQINIKTYIPHPLYNHIEKFNDIGLLELEHPVQLNLHVKPICLYRWNPGTKVGIGMITGWGRTYTSNKTLSEGSTRLLKGVAQYFSAERCNETYTTRAIDAKIQICYGRNEEGHADTCQGDSGVPIQIYNKDVYCSYYAFGISSFGKGCGGLGVPSVYTNVYAYIEWIENTVWP